MSKYIRAKRPMIAVAPALLVFSLIAAVAMPTAALAQTGADATILNVVTVDYSDASGNQAFQASASSSVTVNLVEAALSISGRPVVASPGATAALPAGQTVDSGATATYLYALTANSNGDDIYDLVVGIDATGTADVSGEAVSTQLVGPDGTTAIGGANPATVTLGASVVTDVVGVDTLEFPGGTLAEIAIGDVVVVAGIDYLVTAVTIGSGASHDNAGGIGHTDLGTTTSEVPGQLTLAANGDGAGVPPVFLPTVIGESALEQVLLQVQVTAEAATAGTDGTVAVDIDTNPDGDPGLPATVQDTVTTFTSVDLLIQKDVRNVTDAGAFAATAAGDPGDVLEYRVTVTNTGGLSTNVIVTDAVPDYTQLLAGAYGGSNFAQATLNGGGAVNITTAANDDESATVASGNAAGTAAGSGLNFYVGNTNADSTDSGGDLAPADVIVIIYQVAID